MLVWAVLCYRPDGWRFGVVQKAEQSTRWTCTTGPCRGYRCTNHAGKLSHEWESTSRPRLFFQSGAVECLSGHRRMRQTVSAERASMKLKFSYFGCPAAWRTGVGRHVPERLSITVLRTNYQRMVFCQIRGIDRSFLRTTSAMEQRVRLVHQESTCTSRCFGYTGGCKPRWRAPERRRSLSSIGRRVLTDGIRNYCVRRSGI